MADAPARSDTATRASRPRLRRLVQGLAGLTVGVLLAAGGVTGASAADAPAPGLVAARQHYFGSENVDPATGQVAGDKVILSWATVSTMAASLGGHVVLLDSYIHKVEDRPNYVPTTVKELSALHPEYIFIGHGHSDHAKNAGVIAVQTGATVVGTPKHCAEARAEASSYAPSAPRIDCVVAVSQDSAPGEEVNTLTMMQPDVCVTALKHVHSAAEPPDPDHQVNPPVPVPDLGPLLMHPPGPAAVTGAADAFANTGDEGGSLLYQFRVGDFAVTWNDTVGPLKEEAPNVLGVLRNLPPTDLQAGAILGVNVATNGLRDPAMYIGALRPKVFAPLHHDFITEYGSADDYETAFRNEPQVRNVDPEIRWLSDPHDYVRPGLLTFDVNAPRWDDGAAGAPSCP